MRTLEFDSVCLHHQQDSYLVFFGIGGVTYAHHLIKPTHDLMNMGNEKVI